MAEAVRALVGSFAEPAPDGAESAVDCRTSAESDEELVVAVPEEVIYRLEVFTEIPVATRLRPMEQGRWRVRFTMADAESATLVGAVPKAVSLHGARADIQGTFVTRVWRPADGDGRDEGPLPLGTEGCGRVR